MHVGGDLEGSFFQACKWLDLCGRNGIIQNAEDLNLQRILWNLQDLKSP